MSDGVSFYYYTPPEGSFLLSENLTGICAMSDGVLWTSYLAGGLARFKEDLENDSLI
jgi:hypothetical protein